MSLKYVAFDLETAKEVPPANWRLFRPLGISCAATYAVDGRTVVHKAWPDAPALAEERYPDQLAPFEALRLFEYLEALAADGYTVVTWNGLAFDFDVLFEELQDATLVERMFQLAMLHTDVAFAMFADKGFFVSLQSACVGMRVEEKLEGVHAYEVPSMWQRDRRVQDTVVEYCMQDARSTGLVYESVKYHGYLKWYSKAGKTRYWTVMDRSGRVHISDVSEALQRPEPDVSWMNEPPRTRGSFMEWLMTARGGSGSGY